MPNLLVGRPLRSSYPKDVVFAYDRAQHGGPNRLARTISAALSLSTEFRINRKKETLIPRRPAVFAHVSDEPDVRFGSKADMCSAQADVR